jgi:hypothetical protein
VNVPQAAASNIIRESVCRIPQRQLPGFMPGGGRM